MNSTLMCPPESYLPICFVLNRQSQAESENDVTSKSVRGGAALRSRRLAVRGATQKKNFDSVKFCRNHPVLLVPVQLTSSILLTVRA